tara:strand:+ start:3509 stop:3703 length:195 start_codon:yes stop_codon:yes gene_type:complete
MFKKNKNNKFITTIVKTIEPSEPEIVLFGLILVSLGPFKVLPTIKPPMSDAIQPNKIINKIILS